MTKTVYLTYFYKYSLLLLFSISAVCSYAQVNPTYQTVLVKQGLSDNTVLITSQNQAPSVLISSVGIEYDTLHIAPSGQTNEWKITFKAKSDFIGSVVVPIEYAVNGPIPGLSIYKYAEVEYEIHESIVKSQNDYYLADENVQTLDVLANDEGITNGSLTLDEVSFVEGGIAEIVNNKLEFTLDYNTDRAFVQYITSDSTGNANNGIACLVKENSLPPSVDLSMHNKESLLLHLDDVNATNVSGPSNGALEALSDVTYAYIPNSGYNGTDMVEFEDAQGNSNVFNITIFDKAFNDGFIRDDEFYTPISTSLEFDVFENDLKSNYNIVDFSTELNYLGNGIFNYTPNTGYEGDLSFYYKVFNGVAFKTGNIVIHVSDEAPIETINYSFNILQEEHLELNYLPSISAYTFDLSVPPSNGSVNILDDQGSVVANCENITGENKVIYTPNPGFDGTDQFDIEYCTSSNICSILKIEVQVEDLTSNNCICYNDCVWPGDANADGVVNVQDYILTNLLLGKSGNERDSVDGSWSGNSANNWNFNSGKSKVDYKHADANGDGFVNDLDISIVNTNYGKLHNLIGNRSYVLDDLPVNLVPQNLPVDSGEWLYLDVILGDGNIPAIDFHGIGMNLNIAPELMDSSTVFFNEYADSWVGLQGPINTMMDVPEDGKINIGLTTISSISPSGEGLIGTVGFIVEEGLDGWRLQSSLIDMTISANDIIYMNSTGNSYLLPDTEVIIPIETNPVITDLSNTISLYPNPSVNKSFLSSSKYGIERIQILDITGRVLETRTSRNNDLMELDTQHLLDGLYFVKVYVAGQTVTKKLNKVSL